MLFKYRLIYLCFFILFGCAELPKKEDLKLPPTIAAQSINIKAQLELAKDKNLWDSSHICVISYKNNLLLVGQVPSSSLREQAENIVRKLDNIEEIYNQLEIKPSVTFTQRAKDTWITTQVKAKLVTNRAIESHKVRVITEAGTVYLFGDLNLKQQKLAAKIASEINGVGQVVTVFF